MRMRIPSISMVTVQVTQQSVVVVKLPWNSEVIEHACKWF